LRGVAVFIFCLYPKFTRAFLTRALRAGSYGPVAYSKFTPPNSHLLSREVKQPGPKFTPMKWIDEGRVQDSHLNSHTRKPAGNTGAVWA